MGFVSAVVALFASIHQIGITPAAPIGTVLDRSHSSLPIGFYKWSVNHLRIELAMTIENTYKPDDLSVYGLRYKTQQTICRVLGSRYKYQAQAL